MTQIEEHQVKDIYQGVRGIAVRILNRVERTDSYLEKLLDHELRNSELTSPDKALLFEIVHGVMRWMGRLDWILSGFYKGQFSKAIPILKNALRVALYQIMFLDKIPEYAIVNEAVEFVKKLQGQKPGDITNAVLRNIIRSKNNLRYPNPADNLIGYLAAYYSHPSWLIKRWLERFGREETEQFMLANNERPQLMLRVNLLKVDIGEFRALLDSVNLGYDPGKYLPEFFRLHNLTNITNWKYFGDGYFSIQDESAGIACRAMDVKPGLRVLDLCAAPGGKSTYMADLMSNEGEIVALDRFETRLEVLQKNIDRLGVTIVKTVYTDALEYEDGDFDRVLCDVPCSGLGTITKKPDIKWKKDLLDIRHLAEVQYKLLVKGASLVKPGGIVVYSTCTTEPEENMEVIKRFLENHSNYRLVPITDEFAAELVNTSGTIQTLPYLHEMDGAFIAKLVRES